MKKITTLIMLCMVLVTSAGILPKNNYRLTIEGKFLSEKKIKYEVYKINADSTMSKVDYGRGIHYFSIQVQTNEHYLIKFISRSKGVKYLDIEVSESGYVVVDVDFHRKGSATARFNYKQYGYEVHPIATTQIRYGESKRRGG